ncbi:MAG TPA: 4a-hydroxytetrahydrobiopterin dehydratase [Thermoanaerobaculia bacterium]
MNIEEQLAELPEWEYRDNTLHRELRFATFVEAFSFMTKVAFAAERRNHHPDWSNVYDRVTIRLTTHDAGGVTEKDFELAADIERLYGETDQHFLMAEAVAGTSFVQLPQGTSDYLHYSAPERQFGTPKTIAAVVEVARTVHAADPQLTFAVGDISFEDGAVMPPHKAHRRGRNVDVRPIRKDRGNQPTFISAAEYDRAATGRIIAAFLAHPNVLSVLFNDTKIPGVTPDPGGAKTHDNHFHVQTKA